MIVPLDRLNPNISCLDWWIQFVVHDSVTVCVSVKYLDKIRTKFRESVTGIAMTMRIAMDTIMILDRNANSNNNVSPKEIVE